MGKKETAMIIKNQRLKKAPKKRKRQTQNMIYFCSLGSWVLPVVTAGVSIVAGIMVGYGMWKFRVSPVELENQQLKIENQGLTRELAIAERWKVFYLGAYSRERDAHARGEARSSIIRERLKALEREKDLRVSETEGSSSAGQERSKPAEIELCDKENSGLDTDTAVDLGSSFCPLETFISEIELPFDTASSSSNHTPSAPQAPEEVRIDIASPFEPSVFSAYELAVIGLYVMIIALVGIALLFRCIN